MKAVRLIVTIIIFILLLAVILWDGGVSFLSGLGIWAAYLLILFALLLGVIAFLMRKKNKYSYASIFASLAFCLMVLQHFILKETIVWLECLEYAALIAVIVLFILSMVKKDGPEKK